MNADHLVVFDTQMRQVIANLDGFKRVHGVIAVPPVSLPRRAVTSHKLLPYFSAGGVYVVAVTKDKDGGVVKAKGLGNANVNGFHADLTVTLDLRNLPEGSYYIATTQEGDRAAYYYPPKVR